MSWALNSLLGIQGVLSEKQLDVYGGCHNLKLQREVRTRDINLGVISMQLAVGFMRGDVMIQESLQ